MKTSSQSGRTGLCKPAHPIPVRTFLPQAFALVLLALVVIPVLRASDSQVKPGDGNHDSLASLQSGLGSLPFLSRGRTRSVSAENPTGEKGRGGMAIPNPTEPKPATSGRAADTLGQGWKVRPFLRVNAGQTALLMDVAGPGIIQHMWIVEGLNRGLVLRFYWDDEKTPSIESPVPDFFCVGHGRFAPVNSLPVVVNPAPVYVQRQEAAPPPAPANSANDWWYYCAESKSYYPYVQQCPAGWQRVSPRPAG